MKTKGNASVGTVTDFDGNFSIDGYAKAKPEEKPDLFPDGDNVKGTEGLKIAHAALGDAYFMRAYAIFGLLEYYSPAYSETNATQPDLGASYNLHFSENFNPASYPGRNTLDEIEAALDDVNVSMSTINFSAISSHSSCVGLIICTHTPSLNFSSSCMT